MKSCKYCLEEFFESKIWDGYWCSGCGHYIDSQSKYNPCMLIKNENEKIYIFINFDNNTYYMYFASNHIINDNGNHCIKLFDIEKYESLSERNVYNLLIQTKNNNIMKSCKYCNGSIIDDYCESCFAIYNILSKELIGIMVDIKSDNFIHYIKANGDWIYFYISGSDKEIYEIYFPEYYTNQKENEKIMYDTLIMLKNNLAFV